ncbi:amino acid permease [Helicobacter didelphidarum]|uniref:Amino acid permease n=1 Tax=Helicobacter didelphidarum TaxID=2040648 RepID=A0A3D8IME7_9HELI|nr:amino acid permease [Helicobacter didelphidarum]RDU66096.1 amino acid permease [Helicobacter didelphidarum]
MSGNNTFIREIKTRHLIMIAFGGAMGTGLFVGSGGSIHQAGALGTLIAYCVASVIVYSVMLSLGELSSAFPNTGSFGDYAHRFISPSAGYVIFWMYWLNWVATVAVEYTAIALLISAWFPDVNLYVWVALCAIAIFLLNIFTVKLFAEGEFIVSFIKVFAVLIFLLLGFISIIYNLYLYGFNMTFANFYSANNDQWFPNGFSAVFMTILAVNFAFTGTEVIGVAVGETKDPRNAMPKAIKATLIRIIIFFIGSVFIIATFVPMNDARITESPFVTTLQIIKLPFVENGLPYIPDIMRFILIAALFSTANSGLYASARMIWGLAQKKMYPKIFATINKRGIPVYALLMTMGFSLLPFFFELVIYIALQINPDFSAYINNKNIDNMMESLITVSGFTMMIVWTSISYCQYAFRKQYLASGGKLDDLAYKTPFTPYIQIIGIFGCVISMIGVYFDESQRIAIWGTIIYIVICYIIYFATKNKFKN